MIDEVLDKECCDFAGITPEKVWFVGPNKKSIRIDFDDERNAKAWMDQQQFEGLYLECKLFCIDRYPAVSSDWDDAGILVDALRKKAFLFEFHVSPKNVVVFARQQPFGFFKQGTADTFPLALARVVAELARENR